jgi:hypothetical protein
MTLPGFTAEASFYKTPSSYRLVSRADFPVHGRFEIHLQGCGFWTGLLDGFCQVAASRVIVKALTAATRAAPNKGLKRPRSLSSGSTNHTVAAGRCMHGKHHRELSLRRSHAT